MRMRFAAPLAVGLLSATATAQSVVQIGDTPDYSVAKAYNTMGAQTAQDFRGKPVLIDFWGTK